MLNSFVERSGEKEAVPTEKGQGQNTLLQSYFLLALFQVK